MITRPDISAHLEREVRKGFLRGKDEYTPMRNAFVRTVPSSAAFETYADMGNAPWPVLNAGKQGAGGTDTRTGASIVNKLNTGRQITIIGGEERSLIVYNLEWTIGQAIAHNAINDDKAGDLESWARDAGTNFERHKDKLAFDVLNSGEATTNYGAGYDGLSFFNDSHLDPGAEYQTAQDNKFALTLSLDNFETVKVAAAKFKSSRGEPVGYNHSLLIVPPDLERIGANITMNREAYDTANRETNPYSGNTKMLVAPGGWLDTSAWFVIDPSQTAKPVMLQERESPRLEVHDDPFSGDGGTRYYIWRARYAYFYGDWRLCAQGQT